jgi:hypothetical protein
MKARRSERRIGVLAAAFGLATLCGCDTFENLKDRFKTCQDTVVVLTNSPQTIATVNILAPEEAFGPASELRPGESRQISLCLEKGDTKLFRVWRNGEEVAAVNCVASLANYEAHRPTVTWTQEGIICDGW